MAIFTFQRFNIGFSLICKPAVAPVAKTSPHGMVPYETVTRVRDLLLPFIVMVPPWLRNWFPPEA